MSAKVKVVGSTKMEGTAGKANVHLRLACGHTAWRAKRLSSVACAQCQKGKPR